MKRYAVQEVFATVQGEGYLAGVPAVFIRFAGCNLWSGHDEDRARDAESHGAKCPLWCDTDFRNGTPMLAAEVVQAIRLHAKHAGMFADRFQRQLRLVVLTGGEPALQVDADLVRRIKDEFDLKHGVAIETNGTRSLEGVPLDWVCVSPKTRPDGIHVRVGNELKVLFPDYDPLAYDDLGAFDHRYVSAVAETSEVGKSIIVRDNLRRAAEFCMAHPWWRLTVQTHKVAGLP